MSLSWLDDFNFDFRLGFTNNKFLIWDFNETSHENNVDSNESELSILEKEVFP
jgi:hypothetical protein